MEESKTKGYKRLQVFQEAHSLVLLVYKETRNYPKKELFGLTSQIRRAVMSVAANIVEGQSRASQKEFVQFLRVSNSSLVEVEYYLELSRDLGYLSKEQYADIDKQRRYVGVLLWKFISSLTR